MLTAIAPKARQHADAAIKTLLELMEKGEPDSVRVSAANSLLDRGFGKPVASVEFDLKLTQSLETMSLEQLQELRTKYASLALASPTVIEHDATEQPEDVPIEADEQDDA